MISSDEIKKLEEESGIPRAVLMENAGKGVAKALISRFDVKNKRILVVAYHGNNGGDGFVAARHLCNEAEVDVLFIGDESKLKEEARTNFKKLESNERIQLLSLDVIDFSDYDFIIDAIFGTGIEGEIKDPLATLIKNLDKTKAYKISIDVPSGINPDTGVQANVHFEPDLIITMHDMKEGFEKYKDKVIVADIGIKQ